MGVLSKLQHSKKTKFIIFILLGLFSFNCNAAMSTESALTPEALMQTLI